MAIRAARLDNAVIGPAAFDEMTGKAGIIVYREMFVTFEVTVTRAA